MRGTIEAVIGTILAAAATALVVAWLFRQLLPQRMKNAALADGLALGFLAGYVLLPDWAALHPERHWQWLPYLEMGAAILGAIFTSGAWNWKRWLMYVVVATLTAWLLVPMWETLHPPRLVLIPLLAGYVVVVAGLISALPDRLLGELFIWLLTVSAIGTALAVAIAVSVRFGQVTAIAAASLVGCAVVGLLPAKRTAGMEKEPSPLSLAARALILPFTVTVGGMAFVGAIELDPPLPILLVLPAGPLVLWLFAAGPLARLEGRTAAALQIAAVFAVLAFVLGWLALDSLPAESFQ